MFKLDHSGQGMEIKLENLVRLKELNLRGWTNDDFRHLCMLAGCDYLPSINGLGLKKAYKYLRSSSGRNVEQALMMARLRERLSVPDDYLDLFKKADITFLHQRVYDPRSKKIVPLSPIIRDWGDCDIDVIIGRYSLFVYL